jgi:hypothetical protein
MTAWLSLLLALNASSTGGASTCPEPVFAAIEAGDVGAVLRLVTSAAIDAPGTGACAKRTPLLAAAERGRLDVVDALLSLGADVNFTVVEKAGPLRGRVTAECLARAAGHDEVAALLKKRGGEDTVDGCRKRAALVAALRSEEPARLSKERRAGNRLSVEQLLSAVRVADCEGAPTWCAELVRHLPKTPSPARDEVLDELEQWVGVLPGLEAQLQSASRRGP